MLCNSYTIACPPVRTSVYKTVYCAGIKYVTLLSFDQIQVTRKSKGEHPRSDSMDLAKVFRMFVCLARRYLRVRSSSITK